MPSSQPGSTATGTSIEDIGGKYICRLRERRPTLREGELWRMVLDLTVTVVDQEHPNTTGLKFSNPHETTRSSTRFQTQGFAKNRHPRMIPNWLGTHDGRVRSLPMLGHDSKAYENPTTLN